MVPINFRGVHILINNESEHIEYLYSRPVGVGEAGEASASPLFSHQIKYSCTIFKQSDKLHTQ